MFEVWRYLTIPVGILNETEIVNRYFEVIHVEERTVHSELLADKSERIHFGRQTLQYVREKIKASLSETTLN